MKKDFELGFTTVTEELTAKQLSVIGIIPEWLNGRLIRNGPAQFEKGAHPFLHWFDGLAMLHQFFFENGNVYYTNKFLESNAYKNQNNSHFFAYRDFASTPKKIMERLFWPRSTDNANVNITRVAGKYLALTETMTPIEFDRDTLETIAPFKYNDSLKGMLTTAHPHYDFDKQEAINYQTHFGVKSHYLIYSISHDSSERKIIAKVPSDKPSYMHSFAITKNYVILVEFPFVVNSISLLISNKPLIDYFKWRPDKQTQFLVVDRNTGTLKGKYSTKPFFAFHHINAFEEEDRLIIDLSAYDDARVIEALYLDVLRGVVEKPVIAAGEFRRYCISLTSATVDYQVMSEYPIELPRINYKLVNTKKYRFAYGVSSEKLGASNFFDRLTKVDLQYKTTSVWQEDRCYPGEPVFVSAPHALEEDNGVILSVVLNAKNNNSFLLILNANSFREMARIEVPHPITFGFHGEFFSLPYSPT